MKTFIIVLTVLTSVAGIILGLIAANQEEKAEKIQ